MTQYKCICAQEAKKSVDRRNPCMFCFLRPAAAALELPEPKPVFTDAVSQEVREHVAA